MKRIIFPFLYVLLFYVGVVAQDWKNYPYHPEGSVISFPQDEGRHTGEPEEWWYTTAHLKGMATGNDYSIMLTYFYHPGLGFDGFRIFNIANETAGDFFPDTQPCNYSVMATDHLSIEANKILGTESWVTITDTIEGFLPFQYHLEASSLFGAIDLNYNTVKRPLILGETGYFDQGVGSYTYYYEQTGINVTGTIAMGGEEEAVTGTAWIDRQYGNFNPNSGEAYEWFSVQLSNGMDMSFWDIFTEDYHLPDTITYHMLNVYKDENTSYSTADFELQRLKYSFLPGAPNCYANQWRLTSSQDEVDLTITVINPESEVTFPFSFLEGSTSIAGTVNGVAVSGVGFAEALHHYEHPVIEFGDFGMTDAANWSVTNSDDGNPLLFDVEIKANGMNEFTDLVSGISENFIENTIWSEPCAGNCDLRVIGYSVDTTLTGSKEIHKQTNGIATVHISKDLVLSPNPVTDKVKIDLKTLTNHGAILFLRNSLGEMVWRKKLSRGQLSVEIDLSAYSSGIYFIEISEKNRKHLAQVVKK